MTDREVCEQCGRPKATGHEGVDPGTKEAEALCWNYPATGGLCERLQIARLTAELATAKAELARLKGRRFPIMDAGFSIPWTMIAPFEQQARRNHDQSLERLAERGGLDPVEALAVLDGKKLRVALSGYDPTAARTELLKRMKQYEADAAGRKRT